jgi:PAS domain S-box-containing protein
MQFPLDPARLAALLEALPDFILLVDREAVIQYINRLEPGFEMENVLQMKAGAFLAPESQDAFHAAVDAVFENGAPQSFEVRLTLPDGSPAWYRSDLLPFREDGRTTGVVIRGSNVTEMKDAQETMARVRKLLPMCAWCDRIRTEEGAWESIESYLKRATDTHVSHGLCADCERRMIEGTDGSDGATGRAG